MATGHLRTFNGGFLGAIHKIHYSRQVPNKIKKLPCQHRVDKQQAAEGQKPFDDDVDQSRSCSDLDKCANKLCKSLQTQAHLSSLS